MSDRNSPPLPSPAATDRRRSSFTSQSLAGLFGRQSGGQGNNANGNANGNNNNNNATPAYPGPITSAAAQAQRRRLSLHTVGLAGSPNQSSPFGTNRSRGESISSATSASVDESPFEEGDGPPASASTSSPFARRLSFGVNALRDARSGGSAGSGNSNEGFNFAESMRHRAQRSSISSPSGMPQSPMQNHHRAKSVAAMEPPVKEIPQQAKPDAFQERILKGDFYMD